MTVAINLPGTCIGNLRGLLEAVRDQAALIQPTADPHTQDAAGIILARAISLIELLALSVRVDEQEAEKDDEITAFLAKMAGGRA